MITYVLAPNLITLLITAAQNAYKWAFPKSLVKRFSGESSVSGKQKRNHTKKKRAEYSQKKEEVIVNPLIQMHCKAIAATPRGRTSCMKPGPALTNAAAVKPWGTPGHEMTVEGRIISSSIIFGAGVAS